MNLKGIVLGIVGLAVVAYGGVHFYMYYKVKGGVDEVAQDISAFGRFSYDGVSVSPLGSRFSVDGIQFTPYGFRDGLRVDAVRIHADNMLEFMRLSRERDPNVEFPGEVEISMEGIRMAVDSDWLGEFGDAIVQDLKSSNYRPTVCGGHLMVEADEYMAMGLSEIVADVRFALSHDDVLGRLDNDFEITLRDLARFHYRVVTNAPTSSRLTSFAEMGEPTIRLNKLTYTDLGLTPKTNDFCAKADNTSVEAYIDAQVDQSDYDYLMTWGIVPGEAIRAAYRRFLSDPQTVEIAMDPESGFDPSTLHLYKAQDIPRLLNLQVTVNGQPIEDLSFRTADEVELPEEARADVQYSVAGQLRGLSDSLAPEEQRADDEQAPIEKEAPRYRPVTVKQLKQHVGREIKVVTQTGLTREGTLDRVEGSTIYVVRIMRGGRFTMPVPFDQVKTVEALF